MNCEDNKDRALTVLGLVYGDRFYGLRGDGVAEEIILLTCCFNTSAPELPASWCLENGKGIVRPPPKIEGLDKDFMVVRPTSKQLPHLSQEIYSAWWCRNAFVAIR